MSSEWKSNVRCVFNLVHLSLSLSLSPSSFHSGGKIVLLVLSLIGFIFFDVVYVGAVFNYAAQSEMNIYLLRAIRRLVTQKEYEEIDGGIKVVITKACVYTCNVSNCIKWLMLGATLYQLNFVLSVLSA